MHIAVPPSGNLRQRLLRGTLLKWTENTGYQDRDGVQPVEGPYLLVGLEDGYQKWQDQNVVDEIIDKPLPDLEKLNEAISRNEWETGLDGQPRPPWIHQYTIYLLDPNDGQLYTLINSTVGQRILWESLNERWLVMRHLRGADVIAVVALASRPFKTAKWGIKYRPDLKILDWRKPAGDSGALTGPSSPPPQLPPTSTAASPENPATPITPTSSAPAPVAAPTTSTAPPASQSSARSTSPSKPANAAKDGLSFLEPVRPVTLREEMDDEVRF
jgi:hypothetical protein